MSGSAAIDLEDFGDQGIAFPIEVYAADEARGLKVRYDAFQTEAVARRGHETFIKHHYGISGLSSIFISHRTF